MRVVKLLLVSALALSFLLWSTPEAQAKGPVHRILISGGDLEGEVVITDVGLTSLLSLGYFEDFMAGEIEPPETLSEGYTLVRQFRNGSTYQTFDRTVYYPNEKGERGYVHYLGIENGSSGYDGKWYSVLPEGEMAMQRTLVSLSLTPFLLAVTETGEIYLLDPVTLEQVSVLSIYDDQAKKDRYTVTHLGATVDGQKILLSDMQSAHVLDFSGASRCPAEIGDFVMTSLDGSQVLTRDDLNLQIRDAKTLGLQHMLSAAPIFPSVNGLYAIGLFSDGGNSYLARLDTQDYQFGKAVPLENMPDTHDYKGVWELGFGQFYLTNGERLIVWNLWDETISNDYENMDLRDAEVLRQAGVAIEPIAARDGRLFLYPRLDDTETSGGGIYVVNPHEGAQIRHWQRELKFAHVIAAENVFYALQAPRGADAVQIYMLDAIEGQILNSVELPVGVTYLAYVRLDDISNVLVCSVTNKVPKSSSIVPVTATPAK